MPISNYSPFDSTYISQSLRNFLWMHLISRQFQEFRFYVKRVLGVSIQGTKLILAEPNLIILLLINGICRVTQLWPFLTNVFSKTFQYSNILFFVHLLSFQNQFMMGPNRNLFGIISI